MEALTGIKGSTYYKALGRLKFHKMVTQESNNRFTTISICNWKEYQSSGNNQSNTRSNNQVTTKEQQSNTKQEVENIRNKKKDTKVSFGDPDVNEILSFWERTTNLPINSKVPLNRANARTLLNRHTLDEVKRLIQGAAVANLEEYSGIRISNIVELQMNENKLILWGQKRNQENLTKGVPKI